jgi:hypothetical protein
MNNVKVKKVELLTRLQANRDSHYELFLKAQEGYRQDVIEELDKSLNDARSGKGLRVIIHLQAPQNHTDDYDNVITMLQMSVDDVIEVAAHDFQCYVMDKWPWFQASTAVNTMYASKIK